MARLSSYTPCLPLRQTSTALLALFTIPASCDILYRLNERADNCRGVVVIVGPTAVGKTAVALELVSEIGGEIISADSMAVYVGMDIGTAKPTAEEQRRARFHLIDVADPAKPFNVGEFQKLASEAIEGVLARNPPAVVVGGSGLYVRAAVDGLNLAIPGRNEKLRDQLADEVREFGNERVHERLREIDPVSAERIHPNNVKRVIRAIEIYEFSGVPASVLFDGDARRPRGYPAARWFGLTMNRDALYERIDRRVDNMIAAGLIEEVAGVLEKGVSPDLPSMHGLGYKEIAAYLRGEYGEQEAISLLKLNTRRFAKRQYTWFKADARVRWIDLSVSTAKKVSGIIKGELYK
jgi:tRNA dimethylallyltransferase